MKKTKFTPSAALVASFAAGVELNVIVDGDGIMYLPFAAMPAGAAAVATDTAAPAASSRSTERGGGNAAATVTNYTEKQLMDMDAKTELEPLCHKLGIEIPAEGKNTNKKLRDLILEWQEEQGGASAEQEEQEAPAQSSRRGAAKAEEEGDDVFETVVQILTKVDQGKLSEQKGAEQLVELAETKALKKAVSDVYKKFIDNNTLEIDDIATEITELLSEEEEEKAPATSGRRGAAAATPAKKVAGPRVITEDFAEELAVGDRVSVYWDDLKEWYDGEVGSIKKGVVHIKYDDKTTGDLDDNTTKVKILG